MNTTTSAAFDRSKIYAISMAAVMTAVICVLAPLSIPIGPVPISLTNLVIYFSLYLLGWKLGTASYIVYVLIGMAGLPVFSGFTGGLGKLLGPTGGYIIGFIPMAVIAGLVIERFLFRGLHILAMIAGTVVCYIFGTFWFCITTKTGVLPALNLAVLPFIPVDTVKILLAAVFGPVLCSRLRKAGLTVSFAGKH